ncbi:hypothetical protein ACFQU7_33345 [Pseudoroseomonas wenyumeiae]
MQIRVRPDGRTRAIESDHGDQAPTPRAVLVGIQTPEVDDVAHEASLEELGRLVKTLGYEVVGTVSQRREGTGAGSLLGSGKLAELAALTGGTGVVSSMAPPPRSKARARFEAAAEAAEPAEADQDAARKPEFVIVDHELSPSQIRNLERATGAEVLDRTGVIVEIFHRHAKTREAKLQVEMARLKYVAPGCGNPRVAVSGGRARARARAPWTSTAARSATGSRN